MIQLIEKIKVLNEKTKIINTYQKRINELSDEQFNMFRICGVNHYETTHSSILTELLKNDSSHSFGNKFFEAFLDTLKKENIIPEGYHFSLNEVKVLPEYAINSLGRIDILIKNENQCIIVENKIYASDQFEQLKRYEEYARKSYDNFHLLYLTLWGDEASEQSASGVDYKQISYKHTITKWLERCIEISARNPVIRETLIQYINHINHLTNNKTLSPMNKEIIQLLANEENIDALFTIGESLTEVKNHLINKVFIPQLDEICKDLGLINESREYDRVNTSWSSFLIVNPNWRYYKINFEFQTKGLRNLIKGINHKERGVRNDTTFGVLKLKFKKNNENWVYSDFQEYNYWGKDAMIAIKNGEMAEIFNNEIKRILRETEGLDM